MSDELAIDKRAVRRSFEHAAATYDAAAVLQHEVCARMLERLQYVKHRPGAVLDAGSGTGNAIPSLLERYPDAMVVAVDLARGMLERLIAFLRATTQPREQFVVFRIVEVAIAPGGYTNASPTPLYIWEFPKDEGRHQ